MKGLMYVIDKLGETLAHTEQTLAETQQALQIAQARDPEFSPEEVSIIRRWAENSANNHGHDAAELALAERFASLL